MTSGVMRMLYGYAAMFYGLWTGAYGVVLLLDGDDDGWSRLLVGVALWWAHWWFFVRDPLASQRRPFVVGLREWWDRWGGAVALVAIVGGSWLVMVLLQLGE